MAFQLPRGSTTQSLVALRTIRGTRSKLHRLSSLAAGFNKPILTKEGHTENTGLFGIPELKTSDGFSILKTSVINKANSLVQKAIENCSSPSIVSVFDSISDELCKVADLAEFVRLTHPSLGYVKAAEETSLALGGFVEKLNTNLQLYKALKFAMTNNNVTSHMDSITQHVGNLFLFDFEQSGIHLNENERKKAVSLHEAILGLSAQFTSLSSEPMLMCLEKWPKELPIPFSISNGQIKITSPLYESKDPRVREICYKSYMQIDHERHSILNYLLIARDQLARLLGFDTYAHRALKGTMAAAPQNVDSFLETLLEQLKQPAEIDVNCIKKWKIDDVYDQVKKDVMMWDMRYYMSHIVSESYKLSPQPISEYFSIGSCMEGLNHLFKSLYGIELRIADTPVGEVWAPGVFKLEVSHETEGTLGYIYCDFYIRKGKIPQDCHFTVKGGKELLDGSYQLPVVCLVCNFPPPQKSTPSLLNFGMVENLFHEMGHAMHSMLARTKYQHVTGTRCATDFAEVPSILMEYFATDPRVIRTFARHYKTNQQLPEEFISKICQSRKMFTALEQQTQALYAFVDQRFHGKHPLPDTITDVAANIQNSLYCLPYVKGTAWHLRFGHFSSYGAKYYSYLWSKAVASQIWQQFFIKDPFSRSAGERYRAEMLAHGGGKPSGILVSNMLGEEVTVSGLVGALKEDVAF